MTDTAGRTASGTVTLTVYGPVTITSDPSLPAATHAVAYSFQLTANGGRQPYKWSKVSGNLPRGLSLSSGGLVYGTTSYIGTYTVTLKVTDYSGRRYATQTFTLVIN